VVPNPGWAGATLLEFTIASIANVAVQAVTHALT
jgi:hypothetical protein